MMKKLELKYENDFEEIHKELNIHVSIENDKIKIMISRIFY